jgi:hypothetical protein
VARVDWMLNNELNIGSFGNQISIPLQNMVSKVSILCIIDIILDVCMMLFTRQKIPYVSINTIIATNNQEKRDCSYIIDGNCVGTLCQTFVGTMKYRTNKLFCVLLCARCIPLS